MKRARGNTEGADERRRKQATGRLPMTARPVFSIGHSNHPLDVFLKLLAAIGIDTLADVRSAPYSRFNPHFNRKALSAALEARSIRYLYFGRELGGRPDDPTCFEDGRVSYERVARTARFADGLERLIDATIDRRLAIMCAEKEPLDCHRTLLVGQALAGRGLKVRHILSGGELEDHPDAMDRLLAKHHLGPEGDLLASREESLATAIALQTRGGRRQSAHTAAKRQR